MKTIKLTGVAEHDAARANAVQTATQLHLLFHIGNEAHELDVQIVVLDLDQLVVNLTFVGTALNQNVLEASVAQGAEEIRGDDLVQELLEDHGSAAGDNGHTARLSSGRRHPRTQGGTGTVGGEVVGSVFNTAILVHGVNEVVKGDDGAKRDAVDEVECNGDGGDPEVEEVGGEANGVDLVGHSEAEGE